MRQRLLFSARNGRISIVAIGIVAVIILPALIKRRSVPASFCRICGVRHSQSSWEIRGTNVRFLQTHTVTATPISELLTSKNLLTSHEHQWIASQVVPDPLNEFGPPVVESLEFINAPRVVNFVRDLADFSDPQTVANWRRTVMSPEFSYVLEPALRFFRSPVEGFGDRQKFLAWWQASAFPLYQHLREETEPD